MAPASSADALAPSRPAAAQTLRLGRHADRRSFAALPAVQLASACAVGVLLGSYISLSIVAWTVGFVVALLAASLWPRLAPATHRPAAAPPVAVAVSIAMAAWTTVSKSSADSLSLARHVPRDWAPVVLRGTIDGPVELRPSGLARLPGRSDLPAEQSVLSLRLERVRDGTDWRPLTGRLTVVVQGDVTRRLYGDRVCAYGHWQQIAAPRNPGEEDFRPYYARQRIEARLRVDSPEQLPLLSSGGWGVRRLLSWISNGGDRVLRRWVGPETGPLAAALVLGRRRAVAPETRDQLVATGTAHLLSVSGLHLGIVALLATWGLLMTPLRRQTQLWCVLGICLFYTALTGGRPPVLRAVILVSAVLLATSLGRQPSLLNSLAMAAVVLLVFDPSLLFDTGAQLSFLAVITLVTVGRGVIARARSEVQLEQLEAAAQPPWAALLGRAARRLSDAIRVSFWMWLVTAPLVWHSYGVVAPISVVANVVLIPLMAGSLLAGLLTTATGLLLGPVAAPFGWLCWGLLVLQRTVIELCASIPAGHFWLPSPPTGWVLTCYGALAVAACLRAVALQQNLAPPAQQSIAGTAVSNRAGQGGAFRMTRWLRRAEHVAAHRFKTLLAAWWLSAAATGWWLATAPPAEEAANDSWVLTFIDVGHGTSVLIELPDDGGAWLYDAGRLGDPQWSSAPIERVLWHRGLYRLDGLIVSHADADHYNAVPELLRKFSIGRLVTPPGLMGDRQPGLDALRRSVQQHRTPVHTLHAGRTLEDHRDISWASCLHPPPRRIDGSDNARSIVLAIDSGGTAILLPGDLEMPGTELVLAHQRPSPGGVLMAPHHGSLSQDPLPILQWFRPSVVTVSGGRRAARSEVQRQLAQNGADVRVTAQWGAIQLRIDRAGTISQFHWAIDRWAPLGTADGTAAQAAEGRLRNRASNAF